MALFFGNDQPGVLSPQNCFIAPPTVCHPPMQINQVPDFIQKLSHASPVPLLLGNTGIGKTMAVAQGARLMGKTLAAIPPLSTMLPEDANGVPVPVGDTVKFLPPDFWKIEPGGIIFLDELNLARQDVLSTLCSVLWPLADGKRRIGSLEIPEDTIVIAAAMPPSPGSPAKLLPHFLRSRLRIICVENGVDEWIPWAVRNGIDSVVVAFLKRRADLFSPTPPVTREIVAFPTPRAWARIAYVIQHEKLSNGELAESITGMVGPGAASEFLAFRAHIDVLPDPIDVLLNREPFPQQADVAIATSVAIAQVLLKGSRYNDAYFRYSRNWPAEYVVGLQFPVIKGMTPKWRRDNGWDISTVASEHGEWFDKFADMIEQVN